MSEVGDRTSDEAADVASAAEQRASAAEEVADSVDELSGRVGELLDLFEGFTLDDVGGPVAATGPAMGGQQSTAAPDGGRHGD